MYLSIRSLSLVYDGTTAFGRLQKPASLFHIMSRKISFTKSILFQPPNRKTLLCSYGTVKRSQSGEEPLPSYRLAEIKLVILASFLYNCLVGISALGANHGYVSHLARLSVFEYFYILQTSSVFYLVIMCYSMIACHVCYSIYFKRSIDFSHKWIKNYLINEELPNCPTGKKNGWRYRVGKLRLNSKSNTGTFFFKIVDWQFRILSAYLLACGTWILSLVH